MAFLRCSRTSIPSFYSPAHFWRAAAVRPLRTRALLSGLTAAARPRCPNREVLRLRAAMERMGTEAGLRCERQRAGPSGSLTFGAGKGSLLEALQDDQHG